MKQTAVEWLQEQLKAGVKYNPLEKNGYSIAEKKLFEQAKKMEKQQIKDAYHVGYGDVLHIPQREYNPENYFLQNFLIKQ